MIRFCFCSMKRLIAAVVFAEAFELPERQCRIAGK